MAWLTRFANLLRGRRVDEEIERELKFHLEEKREALEASGMSPKDARRAAAVRFGNYTLQKGRTREMDIAGWVEAGIGDARYGLRQLRLNPGFASVAIVTLALGIGANTAIFQVINAIRLRPLPVRRPSELVMVDRMPHFMTAGNYRSRNSAFTYAQYRAVEGSARAFSGVLAFGTTRFNLNAGGEAKYAAGLHVSPNFLSVLGVAPMMGADFGAAYERPDCGGGAAIVSYAFWQREMGGDPKAIGRTIRLDGRPTPVIGVAPPDFTGLEPERRFDVAVPLCEDNLYAADGKGAMFYRDTWWLTLVGRLRPGWTIERAKTEMGQISPQVFRETMSERYPADVAKAYLKNRFTLAEAGAGISPLRREYGDPLWILLGISGLVLLIACANLANLLLARAGAREREIGVRLAIGASRARVAGQMLVESLLVAAAGAMAGAALAQGISRAMASFLGTEDDPLALRLGLDWRVFAFTSVLGLGACVLFGLAPALRASGFAPVGALRAGGRGTAGGREQNRLRKALVVSQAALSVVLLAGGLLFGRSLWKLLGTPTGIQSKGLMVAIVDAGMAQWSDERKQTEFNELGAGLAVAPGVEAAAGVMFAPFSGSGWNDQARGDGMGGELKETWFNAAGPGYFAVTATPLIAGRDFERGDRAGAPRVAIVNRKFAEDIFGGANPLGRTFRTQAWAGEPEKVYRIVGLVENTKYGGLREKFRPIAWVPLAQRDKGNVGDGVSVMLRVRGPMGPAMEGVKKALERVSPALSVEFRVVDVQIGRTVTRERLMANLSGGFAVLAAVLSTLGIYGLMSYTVARRRNEIGVRMALGADRARVVALVAREAGVLVAAGVVLGLAGALALSRYAESLLYGLKPNDPLTMAMAAALVVGAGLAATVAPARRAARLDPSEALRQE